MVTDEDHCIGDYWQSLITILWSPCNGDHYQADFVTTVASVVFFPSDWKMNYLSNCQKSWNMFDLYNFILLFFSISTLKIPISPFYWLTEWIWVHSRQSRLHWELRSRWRVPWCLQSPPPNHCLTHMILILISSYNYLKKKSNANDATDHHHLLGLEVFIYMPHVTNVLQNQPTIVSIVIFVSFLIWSKVAEPK